LDYAKSYGIFGMEKSVAAQTGPPAVPGWDAQGQSYIDPTKTMCNKPFTECSAQSTYYLQVTLLASGWNVPDFKTDQTSLQVVFATSTWSTTPTTTWTKPAQPPACAALADATIGAASLGIAVEVIATGLIGYYIY